MSRTLNKNTSVNNAGVLGTVRNYRHVNLPSLFTLLYTPYIRGIYLHSLNISFEIDIALVTDNESMFVAN